MLASGCGSSSGTEGGATRAPASVPTTAAVGSVAPSPEQASFDEAFADVLEHTREINDRHGSPFTYSFHGSEAEVVAWCSELDRLLRDFAPQMEPSASDPGLERQLDALRSAIGALLGDLAECASGPIDTPLNRRMNDSLDAYRQAVGDLRSALH